MLSSRWFVPTVVFLVCWTLTTHGKYSASGDEPHYLIVSQSLAEDADLDLRNNYLAKGSARFGVDGLEPEQHVRPARDGRLLSIHDVGLPAVLLPVYVVATVVSEQVPDDVLRAFRMNRGLFAYSLISIVMIAVTAAAAGITQRALVSDGVSVRLAAAIVLAIWLSPPVLSNSFLVFPEPLALLVTACAVLVAVSIRSDALGKRSTLLLVIALGLLPWLHRKFVVYVIAVLIAVAWHQRGRIGRIKVAAVAGLALCFAAPIAALGVWTWSYWGNLGGPLTLDGVPLYWSALPTGVLGLLVDRENGLLVWAPIYLFLPVCWALSPRSLIWLLPALTLFAVSAAHNQWWGGFSPAARFLVPLAPAFALVLGRVLPVRRLRLAFVALLLPQILISAYGWQHPRALWPRGDGDNRTLSAVLGWFGAGDGFLPSLRAPTPEIGRAFLLLTIVLLANVTLWRAARRRIVVRNREIE